MKEETSVVIGLFVGILIGMYGGFLLFADHSPEENQKQVTYYCTGFSHYLGYISLYTISYPEKQNCAPLEKEGEEKATKEANEYRLKYREWCTKKDSLSWEDYQRCEEFKTLIEL